MLRAIRRRLGISAVVIAAIWLARPWLDALVGVNGAIFMGIGLLLAVLWIPRPARRYQHDLREALVSAALAFLPDLTHVRKVSNDRFDTERFTALGLVPDHGSVWLEDMFSGHHRGTSFRMVQTVMADTSRYSVRKPFRGLLFEISVPTAFSARVLIAPNGKLDTPEWASSVAFPDRKFERTFTVFTDEPEEARRLLPDAFLPMLTQLVDDFRGKPVTAGFADGKFMLAVPIRRDLFEPRPLLLGGADLRRDMRQLLRDIRLAYDVIDRLHGVP